MMRTSTLTALAPADRLDLALLQRAQQLDLRGRRQFADLVEEQRAAVGLDEFAGVLFGGAGEGAFLVAEQNQLDQVLRHGAAIDRDEGLGAAGAGAVDGARDQLLADAGFAFDQHRELSEAAAFSAALSTGCIAGERVMTSAMVSVPSRLALDAAAIRPPAPWSPSALRSETCSRSGLAGLTTKSVAPARIADTTLSMPPWAVCTITGMSRPASRMRASTPRPSRSGITRSSTTQSMRCAAAEQRHGRIAAVGDDGLVAEALDHGLEQAALDRIVIDDEHGFGHDDLATLGGCADLVQCRRSGLMGC